MTAILRIEHPVAGLDRWQEAFNTQSERRERGGLICYRVTRAHDDPNHVQIDLEFDDADHAQRFLAGLRKMWAGVDVMHDPQDANPRTGRPTPGEPAAVKPPALA
jgi:hypothetical protein